MEAGNLGASDEAQLSYATERGMAILTYNIQDFIKLAQTWHASGRKHAGIIVSEQFSQRSFGELLRRVLRLLDSSQPKKSTTESFTFSSLSLDSGKPFFSSRLDALTSYPLRPTLYPVEWRLRLLHGANALPAYAFRFSDLKRYPIIDQP